MRHSELLVPVVEDLLVQAGIQAADLDGVIFGSGPGSFTGIRLAAAFSQGLAMASGAQCFEVPSFQIWAQGVTDYLKTDRVLIAQDAQKGQIYAGAYALSEGIMQPLIKPCLINPVALTAPDSKPWPIAGNAWFKLSDQMPGCDQWMQDRYILNWLPRAEDAFALLPVARIFDATVELNYLREATDWKPWQADLG